ncbi:MAG: ribonuclease HII [Thermoanaerobacteraceae bacterium]|nr:ribonuclease HII [Thermoanaerobacteraceae bacterium]
MLAEKSIAEIKSMLSEREITPDLLAQLRRDSRKGVQQLYRQILKRQQEIGVKRQRIRNMIAFDRKYLPPTGLLAGVDEAGRGPLAGPVVAAAVILSYDRELPLDLNDSKQLSPEKREQVAEQIKDCALAYGIGTISAEVIDEINIYQASILAMMKALEKLPKKPELVLIDGIYIESLKIANKRVVKGDQKSAAVAAASIIAKVERDRIMKEYAKRYPGYGFERHFGYPTEAHRKAIQEKGVLPIHRKTFAGVKEWL